MSEEEPDARALRESEQRFRALSEAAREAVFINENGIIREANHAFLALLGYTRQELIGQNGLELFVAPESRAAVVASIRSAGTGGTSEITLITKTGGAPTGRIELGGHHLSGPPDARGHDAGPDRASSRRGRLARERRTPACGDERRTHG